MDVRSRIARRMAQSRIARQNCAARLHAEAELAVDEGGAALARLADAHHDARQHVGRHPAAVVDDPQAPLRARDVDVHRHRPQVRVGLAVVQRLGVVERVVDEFHQDARRREVALGHVVEQQRRRRHLQLEQLVRRRAHVGRLGRGLLLDHLRREFVAFSGARGDAARSAARETSAPRDTSDVVRCCMRARRM